MDFSFEAYRKPYSAGIRASVDIRRVTIGLILHLGGNPTILNIGIMDMDSAADGCVEVLCLRIFFFTFNLYYFVDFGEEE